MYGDRSRSPDLPTVRVDNGMGVTSIVDTSFGGAPSPAHRVLSAGPPMRLRVKFGGTFTYRRCEIRASLPMSAWIVEGNFTREGGIEAVAPFDDATVRLPR